MSTTSTEARLLKLFLPVLALGKQRVLEGHVPTHQGIRSGEIWVKETDFATKHFHPNDGKNVAGRPEERHCQQWAHRPQNQGAECAGARGTCSPLRMEQGSATGSSRQGCSSHSPDGPSLTESPAALSRVCEPPPVGHLLGRPELSVQGHGKLTLPVGSIHKLKNGAASKLEG